MIEVPENINLTLETLPNLVMSRDRDPRIKMSNQDDVVVLSQENI